MSDTKSGSSAGGSKPTIAFIGDAARQHVFNAMTFVVNKPSHHVSLATFNGKSGNSKTFIAGKAKERDDWRAEGKQAAAGNDPFGGGEKMGFLGMLYLALSKPPKSGNCGEMALLAYQKIISTAIAGNRTLGAAAVQIGAEGNWEGNHAFVLVGSDAAFIAELAKGAGKLAVDAFELPSAWGANVYVVDPWIDDGACGTFRANAPYGAFSNHETYWEAYLKRVAKQAQDRRVTVALNDDRNARKFSLLVDDYCIVTGE